MIIKLIIIQINIKSMKSFLFLIDLLYIKIIFSILKNYYFDVNVDIIILKIQ